MRSLTGTRSKRRRATGPWSEVFSQRLRSRIHRGGQGRGGRARLCRRLHRAARLRDDLPALHGLHPRRRPVLMRRSATCSPRHRTNIRASPRPAPARSGSKMPARPGSPASSAIRHDAAGTLTSGGSIANLTAVVAAREARDPEGGGAVYVTRFAHHCIDKALHIAGRGRSPQAADRDRRRYRMSVEALEAGARRRPPQRHPAMARRRFCGDRRHRRDRSAAGDRRSLPPLWRLAPCRRRLWRPVLAVR